MRHQNRIDFYLKQRSKIQSKYILRPFPPSLPPSPPPPPLPLALLLTGLGKDAVGNAAKRHVKPSALYRSNTIPLTGLLFRLGLFRGALCRLKGLAVIRNTCRNHGDERRCAAECKSWEQNEIQDGIMTWRSTFDHSSEESKLVIGLFLSRLLLQSLRYGFRCIT